MKLEQQVVNRELSEKIEGCKDESIFCWHYHPESESYFVEKRGYISFDGMSQELYPAYTVAELGEEIKKLKGKLDNSTLPKELQMGDDEDIANKMFDVNYWVKIVIYLKENKLI